MLKLSVGRTFVQRLRRRKVDVAFEERGCSQPAIRHRKVLSDRTYYDSRCRKNGPTVLRMLSAHWPTEQGSCQERWQTAGLPLSLPVSCSSSDMLAGWIQIHCIITNCDKSWAPSSATRLQTACRLCSALPSFVDGAGECQTCFYAGSLLPLEGFQTCLSSTPAAQ